MYFIDVGPLPTLDRTHNSSPLPPLQTLQPILPNHLSTPTTENRQSKKRVRFTLKLETVQEDLTPLYDVKPDIHTINSSKQVFNRWRENAPLYGVYVEHLEKQGALKADASALDRSARQSPSQLQTQKPMLEPSAKANIGQADRKSPEIVRESNQVNILPSLNLPRVIHQNSATKKNNNNLNNQRQVPLPVLDSSSKQRVNSTTSSNSSQSKKLPTSIGNKKQPNLLNPTVKRGESALPPIKDTKSNMKSNRTDNSAYTKIANDNLQSKRISDTVPGSSLTTNSPYQNLFEHSISLKLSKTSESAFQNRINNEIYFFQNHHNIQLQPVLH